MEEQKTRSQKLHTFVVCAYKESPYLEECIQSLLGQSVKSEILIATSTPNLYIEQIAAKYGIPYLVNEKGEGITQDWNFAYSCAAGRYITIAHQDDVYLKDYTKTVLDLCSRSKKPLIFFCDYFEIRDGKRIDQNRLLWIKKAMLFPLRLRILKSSVWMRRRILSFGSPICCPSVTYASENLPDVIFRDGFRACEDWEAWELLSRFKGDFIYAPHILMGHRIHAGSETTAIIENNERSKEEYQMYRKFWPECAARILTKVYAAGQKSNQINK
jgi:glycosyltransferase involved in cell wall biosynthesis